MKCLEKDRTRRYETANGLAADIARHLGNEPVLARPPSTAYRFQKAWRRNRVTYSASLAVAVALVLGSGASLWQAHQAERARDSETHARLEAERARLASEQDKQTALASLREARRTAYMADMRIVHDSIQSNNMGRARRILNDHRPRSGEADFRDWEWFRFERLAWTDDGEIIGAYPGGARNLFTAADGIFTTFDRATTVDFTEADGPIQIWDGERRRLLAGFPSPPGTTALALSPDGKRLAIARGLDIEIRPTDEPVSILTVLTNWHRNASVQRINVMRFIDGGSRLALGGRGAGSAIKPLLIVDVLTDTGVPILGVEPNRGVFSLALSQNGQFLAANLNGSEVVVLELPEGRIRSKFKLPDSQEVSRGITPVVFVHRDQQLATASETGKIDLWDVKTGQRLKAIGEHASSVTELSVSPDGSRLASSGLDQLIKVWDLSEEGSPARVFRGHEDEVWGVGFLPDGESLVSCSRDQSVRLWDLRQPVRGDEEWSLPPGHVFATLGSGILAAVKPLERWSVWDVSLIPEPLEPRIVSPPPALQDATVLPLLGTDYLLVISQPIGEAQRGWRAALYRGLKNPGPVAAFPEVGIRGKADIHTSKQRLLLHCRVNGIAHLLVWNIKDEKVDQLTRTDITHASTMTMSPDGSFVLLGDRGGSIEYVDLRSGASELWPAFLPGSIGAIAILPDNRTSLIASSPGILRKIDLPTRRTLKEVAGSLLAIESMSLHPRGSRFATGDAQGVVRLWDVETLREVAVLETHRGRVGGIHFQPDGRTLLSADPTQLRVWRSGDASSSQQVNR